jgi:catalase
MMYWEESLAGRIFSCMANKHLTTANGVPVSDNQNSITAGERGPIVLEDFHLFEKLAHFNRERIPERVVHAKGSGAFGELTITRDITQYTKAKLFSQIGKRTPLFIRFSTVGGEAGSADTERDPRGFSIKFYTEEGNWDLVGNNTPVFFLRDPSKFPDFIHTQKRHPQTHLKNATMQWDFWSLHPESLHQVTILFSDRGIPDGYRFMDGFGSHTFSMVNAKNERFYVKYHFKTKQGIKNLTPKKASELAGSDPDHAQRDLFEAIERGEFPKWTMMIQVLSEADAINAKINPFDVTKVWPHKEFPRILVGELTLNRNPANYYADVEQAAFAPSSVVPGLGFSPDRMLQGRLFAYADAHRYRLGVNYHQIPVNKPINETTTYHRDGAARADGNGGAGHNYHPNSFDGVDVVKGSDVPASALRGATTRHDHRNDDDYYSQAGDLYRLMNADQKALLVSNIAGAMKSVPIEIQKRQIAHFKKADPAYGDGVEKALTAMRLAPFASV